MSRSRTNGSPTSSPPSFACWSRYSIAASRKPGGDATVTWFRDGIQVIDGWETFVRRLPDADRADVFVTGSSSSLLSRGIAPALRGRGWPALLHPFSFEEALRHRGHGVPAEPNAMTRSRRLMIERAFLDWLGVGGFPETQGVDPATRRQLFRDYVDVAMFRDVVERHDVRNVTGLRWLVRHLLGNAACRFTVERFNSALRSQGSASPRTPRISISHTSRTAFLTG